MKLHEEGGKGNIYYNEIAATNGFDPARKVF